MMQKEKGRIDVFGRQEETQFVLRWQHSNAPEVFRRKMHFQYNLMLVLPK